MYIYSSYLIVLKNEKKKTQKNTLANLLGTPH